MFVDESARGGYLLAATLIAPTDLHTTRSMMRNLLLPGERRVHFTSEKDTRRKYIVSRLVERNFEVLAVSKQGTSEAVRATLLTHLTEEAINRCVTRLVLDSRDPEGNRRDRSMPARTKAQDAGLVYEHLQSSTEPALWISDAVAWCLGAGGDWRRRIAPIVTASRPRTRKREAQAATVRKRTWAHFSPPSGRSQATTIRAHRIEIDPCPFRVSLADGQATDLRSAM